MAKVDVNQDLCNGCRACSRVCPVNVFDIKDGKSYSTRAEFCMACGLCEVECPVKAIKVNRPAPVGATVAAPTPAPVAPAAPVPVTPAAQPQPLRPAAFEPSPVAAVPAQPPAWSTPAPAAATPAAPPPSWSAAPPAPLLAPSWPTTSSSPPPAATWPSTPPPAPAPAAPAWPTTPAAPAASAAPVAPPSWPTSPATAVPAPSAPPAASSAPPVWPSPPAPQSPAAPPSWPSAAAPAAPSAPTVGHTAPTPAPLPGFPAAPANPREADQEAGGWGYFGGTVVARGQQTPAIDAPASPQATILASSAGIEGQGRKMFIAVADLCSGCRLCEMACALKHTGTFNPYRAAIKVTQVHEEGLFVPNICRHCKNPPACQRACPVAAITTDPRTNVAVLDHSKCINCLNCVYACPFGAIPVGPNGEVHKCDLCGGDPMCVKYCPKAPAHSTPYQPYPRAACLQYVDPYDVTRMRRMADVEKKTSEGTGTGH